jgi:hypothetical protein
MSRAGLVFGVLLLLVTVGGLVAYKATGSLAVIGKVQATGALKPRFDLLAAGAFERTLSYFNTVWPALLFGVVISGAVRAFVSPRWLAGLFGGGRVRSQLVAGLAGAPLMLCSCCVAPVFTSVYERSSRLAPSLALMLAALLVAAVAVPLVLPTFFEIPLAFLLLGAGMPAGAAVALLVAGPATNLPSLLTVGRATGWRVSLLVGAAVWAMAAAAGLLANFV